MSKRLLALSLLTLLTGCFGVGFHHLVLDGVMHEEEDISGFSCISNDLCLVISDETNSVQRAKISNRKLILDKEILSLGEFKKENDLEGITNDGKYFYVTGSHSLSRSKNKYQSSRFLIFKILVGNKDKLEEVKTASMEKFILSSKTLSPFYKKPVKENGIDIEGLAFNKGNIYLGFRSPVLDGKAQILSASVKDIFTNTGSYSANHYQIPTEEEHRGIRGLEFRGDTLFMLTGKDDYKKPKKPRKKPRSKWAGKPRVTHVLARLHSVDLINQKIQESYAVPFNKAKAEAFEFINEKDVVFFFDSEPEGMPIVLKNFKINLIKE